MASPPPSIVSPPPIVETLTPQNPSRPCPSWAKQRAANPDKLSWSGLNQSDYDSVRCILFICPNHTFENNHLWFIKHKKSNLTRISCWNKQICLFLSLVQMPPEHFWLVKLHSLIIQGGLVPCSALAQHEAKTSEKSQKKRPASKIWSVHWLTVMCWKHGLTGGSWQRSRAGRSQGDHHEGEERGRGGSNLLEASGSVFMSTF